jgi:hypothetical protein
LGDTPCTKPLWGQHLVPPVLGEPLGDTTLETPFWATHIG